MNGFEQVWWKEVDKAGAAVLIQKGGVIISDWLLLQRWPLE